MNNRKVFASNLKYYMDLNGKSRKEVAEAIGVSYFTFTDWVNGKKFPRMDKVEKLAKYFAIKISDLIEEKSITEKIEESPVEMAELHFEMIMDEDIAEIFEDFKKLDAKQKKIIKNLIHDMAETEA